jgi:hypothetical protein
VTVGRCPPSCCQLVVGSGFAQPTTCVITKTKKGSKKGFKKDGADIGKDLSRVIYFLCHEMGHYVGQCPLKKKGKGVK